MAASAGVRAKLSSAALSVPGRKGRRGTRRGGAEQPAVAPLESHRAWHAGDVPRGPVTPKEPVERTLADGRGGREPGAASGPSAMSCEGGHNFRRVAIRRKYSPFYLPLGTPRPWRPSSHVGRAETATFRSQAPADGPGECLAGQGWAGALPRVKDAPVSLQLGRVSQRAEPGHPPLTDCVPSPKGPWAGTREGLSLPWRSLIREFRK